jgi:hypothetical protein
MQAMMEKMMNDWMKNLGGLNYFGNPGKMDFMNKDFMKSMNISKAGHQLIEGQKTMFNNTYDMLLKIQEQTEKVADTVMTDHAMIPGFDLKHLKGWRDMVKKGQKEFKKAVDEGFKQSEALFDNFEQFSAPLKETTKPSKASKAGKK